MSSVLLKARELGVISMCLLFPLSLNEADEEAFFFCGTDKGGALCCIEHSPRQFPREYKTVS